MIRDTDELAILRDLKARVARLESSSNLEHSAIDHGQMRFVTSTLRMESGSTLILSGTLTGSGQLTWTGAWTMSGEGTISGPVDITGAVTITGPLDIDGDTTISGDVTVTGGGQITVDGAHPIVLRNDAGEAVVDLGVGDLRSNGTQAGINAGAFWAGVAAAGAILGTADGSRQFAATAAGLYARGVGAVGSGTGTVVALGIDQDNRLVRMSAPV